MDHNRVELQWAVVASDGSMAPVVVVAGGVGMANGAGVLPDDRPTWLADSSAFVVRSRLDGVTGLFQIARDGTGRVRLTGDDAEVTQATPAADGHAIVATYAPGPAAVAAQERALVDQGVHLDHSVDLSIGAIGGSDAGDGPISVRMTGDWFTRQPLLANTREVMITLPGSALAPPYRASAGSLTVTAACRVVDCKDATIAAIVAIPNQAAWLVTRLDRALDQQLFVIRGGRARRLAGGDGLLSGSRDENAPCAVTTAAAFCVAASAGAPPRLVRIDLNDGRQTELYAPNAALARRLPAKIERIRWQGARQRLFNGVLLLPPGASSNRLPMVLQYYRCSGFLRGGVGDELPFQLLVTDNIIGLCINRAPARPGEDRLQDYRVGLAGIRAAIGQLSRRRLVDPGRVGMQGLSFGSELTMWVLRRSRLLRAAAIATGQIEASTYWFGNLPGRNVPDTLGSVYGLGMPDHRSRRWRTMGPASDVESIRAPLLLQLPEAEARWSMELITRLARAGKLVDAYVFPAAAHIKFLPRQKDSAYARNRAWFALWLGANALARDPRQVWARWFNRLGSTGSAQ